MYSVVPSGASVISFFAILNFLRFLDAISPLRFSRKRSASGSAREERALRHIFPVSNSHDRRQRHLLKCLFFCPLCSYRQAKEEAQRPCNYHQPSRRRNSTPRMGKLNFSFPRHSTRDASLACSITREHHFSLFVCLSLLSCLAFYHLPRCPTVPPD